MSNFEHLHQKLKSKERHLSADHQIITPDSGVPAELQAQWMIELLQAVYTEHGIAKSPEKVVESIASGQCRCWFILENGQPVAVAALVTQNDGSVELGRAVALTPGLGLGSIAMLRAGLEQLENGLTQLVAEVRVADSFEGVPSGEATQNILFKHFELKPHAVAPMFNHGEPVRQEMFALASSQDLQPSEPLFLPDQRSALSAVGPATTLSRNLFTAPELLAAAQPLQTGFELVQEAPFSVLVPVAGGSNLETVEKRSQEKNNFSLLPVELSPANAALILVCLEAGWVACGVDRNLGPNSHPVLLLGKLRPGTLLAPMKVVGEHVGQSNLVAITQIDQKFRKAQS